jgi:MFS family permease
MDVHQVNSRALHDGPDDDGFEVIEQQQQQLGQHDGGVGGADLEKHVTAASTAAASYNETYPEGGLKAWSVVMGSWFSLFASLGLMNTVGLFHAYVLSHQLKGQTDATVGWIFSIYTFLAFFCGVYIGPIFDKYGPRWLVVAGAACTVGGVVALSFSTGESLTGT